MEEIERAAMRTKDLTQQLLTFSKGGEPIKEIVSVAELLKETALFTLRGSNARCTFDLPKNLWPVSIDAGQISQVISNIVINAEQAMRQANRKFIEIETIESNSVFADCDLEKTLDGAARAGFANQGQVCLCGSRILVERSIHDEFVERLAAKAAEITIGSPRWGCSAGRIPLPTSTRRTIP